MRQDRPVSTSRQRRAGMQTAGQTHRDGDGLRTDAFRELLEANRIRRERRLARGRRNQAILAVVLLSLAMLAITGLVVAVLQ